MVDSNHKVTFTANDLLVTDARTQQMVLHVPRAINGYWLLGVNSAEYLMVVENIINQSPNEEIKGLTPWSVDRGSVGDTYNKPPLDSPSPEHLVHEFIRNMTDNLALFREAAELAHTKSRFEALTQDSRCDNVLLEYRLAIELLDRGLLERNYPVMIGDVDVSSGVYGNYFAQGCHPAPRDQVVVQAVEEKLFEHLEGQGLGLALRDGISVKSILDAVTINQGGFLQGSSGVHALLDAQVDIIVKMVRSMDSASSSSPPSPFLPLDFAQQLCDLKAETEAERRRAEALEGEVTQLRLLLSSLTGGASSTELASK